MADDSGGQQSSSMVYMLTTIDNPYNPFTEWDEWYAFDARKGYHTPSFLARIAETSDELSETDQALALQLAIEEIATLNVSGIHKRVTQDSFVPGSPIPDSSS
jgi:hypothetical protein